MSDLINASFEWVGAFFIFLHILQLHKDKKVRGVCIGSVVFFSVWGYWNIYYYPSLGQWMSGLAGTVLALFNTVWLIQMIYYQRKEKQCGQK